MYRMSATAEKILSYNNWIQDIEIDGVHTLGGDDPKRPVHVNRTRVRRELFLEPMLRSGYLEGKEVLDLGCSYGYWAMAAAKEGKAQHVLGVDALPGSIEQANWLLSRLQTANCAFELADVYGRLRELPDDSYDVVLCLGFFYHIRDPYLLLSEMSRVAREVVVIDTMVHNSEEASISVRPVRPKSLLSKSVLGLELFSSPKAIFWMALEAGYSEISSLTADFEKDPVGIWDYRNGHRASYALSNGPELKAIFDNAVPLSYLTPSEDIARFDVYPELRGGRVDIDLNE